MPVACSTAGGNEDLARISSRRLRYLASATTPTISMSGFTCGPRPVADVVAERAAAGKVALGEGLVHHHGFGGLDVVAVIEFAARFHGSCPGS